MNEKKPIFNPREMVQQIRIPSLPGDLGRTGVFLGVLSLPLLPFEISLDMSVEFEFLPAYRLDLPERRRPAGGGGR